LNSLNTLKYELHFLSAYIPEVSININYILIVIVLDWISLIGYITF
jgi:hypothetical protein